MKNVFKTSSLLVHKLPPLPNRTLGYFTLVVCFFVLVGVVLLTSPRVPSRFRFFSVQSGSMFPTLQEGDFLVTKTEQLYTEGQIITFMDVNTSNGHSITHRVEGVYPLSEALYQTKGDANTRSDEQLVLHSSVLGRVIWKIPALGTLLDWIKTPLGLVLCIFLPSIGIVLTEFRRIVAELRRT